ncbi:unnamed protein product [Rhizoctonia solani]|uniref:F-box domain-containing protein n=1 Tax=Rhizoctonia solani TaxID=456999 RepID=A0A8H3DZ48_9AGAM|nr:unnamed protein product [Rhizoctonia solani]
MSTPHTCQGSCGAIWRWEAASESLINALEGYQRSCGLLESSLSVDYGSKDLGLRIDSSLKTLDAKIADELTQSRLILVRMRNKISSRFYSLPKKILAQIFMNVVYRPAATYMATHLNKIYSRLHTLLAVCTTWRKAGIAHEPLWAIIPVYEAFGRPKPLATRLSLGRSMADRYSNRGIHLAALISRHNGSFIPSVGGGIPKFNTVNVMSESARAIMRLLDDLARPRGSWPTRQHLSELSIYHVRPQSRHFQGPPEYPDFFYDCVMYSMTGRAQNPLLELFQSLSILRVRGAGMLWDQIKLSNQLVELRLQSVNFRSESELYDFFEALSSAPELRDLKIISVIAFSEPDSDSPSAPRSVKCPVSKLQTLLLKDLDFNVLHVLQCSLAPGTYRTTLYLTQQTTHIHEPRKEPIAMDHKDLCRVLKRISVDKLVLCGEIYDKKAWLNSTELHDVLRSLPTVKTLIMICWKFREEDLLALERPRSRGKGSKNPRFPRLTALYLEDAAMLDAGVLKSVVASHKLEKMTLSGFVAPAPDSHSDSDIEVDGSESVGDFRNWMDWHYLEPQDKIPKWLKTQVGQFCLGGVPKAELRDYDTSEWEL